MENDNEYSIIPFNEHIAAVLNIKDSLNKSEYLCLGFISKDSMLIKSNAELGEYLVSNDNSKISVKQSEVNISSENLYLNGNRIQSTMDLAKIFASKDELQNSIESIGSLTINNEELNSESLSFIIMDLKKRVSELENIVKILNKGD